MTRSERWLPYLFLAPCLILLVVFRLLPALAGFRESLYSHGLSLTGGRQFVGLDNFSHNLQDPVFWRSFRVTLLFSLVINPLQTALALGLALLMHQRVRGIGLFRTIYLAPVAISMNVAAVVWGLMLDRNGGLVNGILAQLDLPRQPFLTAASHALWTIVGICTWKGAPLWALFFLAGLQAIPLPVLEAAQIDGATRWQTLVHVTLPLLRRVIMLVLVGATVENFILFTPVYLLTRGGPELSTNLVMHEAYRRGFVYGDLGSSAAMTCMLLGLIMIFVLVEAMLLQARRA